MNTEIVTKKKPFCLSPLEKVVLQRIINLRTDSSCVFKKIKEDVDLLSDYPKTLSLFERSCIVFPQILSFLDQSLQNNIVLKSINDLTEFLSLKNILSLRLISKTICELVSIFRFLEKKATVSLPYSQLQPIHSSIQEKFSFIKHDNTGICIISSMDHLLSLPSALDLVQENQPTICLELQNINELNRLLMLIAKQKESFEDVLPTVKNQIVKLNLRKITITRSNIHQIYSLLDFKNLVYLPAVSEIAFGNIDADFTMPGMFHGIKSLSFGDVCSNRTLHLSTSHSNLKNIFIGNNYGITQISDVFPCLENLSIGNIYQDHAVKLPASLPLKSFSIGNIHRNYNLSGSFPNLSDLSIGNIGNPYCTPTFELTTSVPNLLNLTIRNLEFHFNHHNGLHYHAIIHLPKLLPNLKTLNIGDIENGNTIKLPDLPNLAYLNIGDIHRSAALKFPNSLDALIDLVIINIYLGSTLKLPSSLKSLQRLSFGNIEGQYWGPWLRGHSVNLKLPPLLNLICFSIGNVGSGTVLELPSSLPKLKDQLIGNIADDDTFLKISIVLNSKEVNN